MIQQPTTNTDKQLRNKMEAKEAWKKDKNKKKKGRKKQSKHHKSSKKANHDGSDLATTSNAAPVTPTHSPGTDRGSTGISIGLNTKMMKHFDTEDGYRPFEGTVDGIEMDGKEILYRIKYYEDDDKEDMVYDELQPCIQLYRDIHTNTPVNMILPVDENAAYYITKENDTPITIAKKVGCQVQDITENEANKLRYDQDGDEIGPTSRFSKRVAIYINPSRWDPEKVKCLLFKDGKIASTAKVNLTAGIQLETPCKRVASFDANEDTAIAGPASAWRCSEDGMNVKKNGLTMSPSSNGETLCLETRGQEHQTKPLLIERIRILEHEFGVESEKIYISKQRIQILLDNAGLMRDGYTIAECIEQLEDSVF
jgi:hypothetical protein